MRKEKEMKTQQTTKSLSVLAILFIILCGQVCTQASGPSFYEDFSDGDPADGSPVLWHPIFVWDGTGYTLTDEGLDVAGALLCDPDGEVCIYDDVAVTVEIRRYANNSGAQWASGFLFRYNENWSNGYWMEVRGPNRFLLGYSSGAILAQATLPFNVDEKDIMIHMETRGNRIEGWCWTVGQSMPAEPQISVVHTNASTGRIALHAWTVGGQSIFRSVEIYPLNTPIADLNGDGKVNTKDILKMIECWGQNNPSADLNGNGVVDEMDLEILMEYWGKDIKDYTLKAHWALDEEQGAFACDSVSGNDAYVMGEPLWQPSSGQVDGALQLDGVDDFIVTGPVSNSMKGSFSILAWIKGGTAGQTIISEVGGVNWLSADPLDGSLLTELTDTSRNRGPLQSETIITDGDWHRIGLVWDGSNRTLFVDGMIIAQDTQEGLTNSANGLYIGTGKNVEQGTYWSGLIDDVRIYSRAISP